MKKLFLVVSAAAFLAASCKKDDTPSGETAVSETFSASLTLDSAHTLQTGDLPAHATMTHVQNYPAIDTTCVDYLAYFDSQFITDDLGQQVGRIMVGLSGFSYKISEYTAGALPFNQSILSAGTAYYADSSETPGPEVVFVDLNGWHWSTRYGSQAGSTFTITKNIQGNSSDRRYLEGTFSCTVYNEFDPSQSHTITNGQFDIFLPKANL